MDQRTLAIELGAVGTMRLLVGGGGELEWGAYVLLALLGESVALEVPPHAQTLRSLHFDEVHSPSESPPLRCLCIDGGGSKGLVAIEAIRSPLPLHHKMNDIFHDPRKS